MTDHADVILRFPLPLPANVNFTSLGALSGDELSRIVASNLHPGEQVKIRPKDRALDGELDAERALAARSALAGQVLTIASSTIEILSSGYYRARHGIEGHDIQIAAAALVDAVSLEVGYGVMVRHDEQNWLCLFEGDDAMERPAEEIKFALEPIPIDEYGRHTRWNLGIDRIGQAEFDAMLASDPISGEFHIRRDGDKLALVAVPWSSGVGDNELAAVARRIPGFVATREVRSEATEMTL